MDQIKYTFLLCSERSGSNLVTKLLNNHSKICGPATKHLINPLARNYFRYEPINEKENWKQLVEDLLGLFNAPFSVWKTSFTLDEILDSVPPGDINALLNYFFSKEARANDNKKHLFVKEIKLYAFYPFLKVFFPRCNFFYQVRDPRDMALSWKKSRIHKGGVIAAARQWKNDQQQYLKIKTLESKNNNISSIRYEDLVTNAEKALTPYLNSLGLVFEESMMVLNKDKLTEQNAQKQEAWKNLNKPLMNNNFNKYQEELTDDEIKYIESICYFEMRHLGYKPDYSWETLEKVNSNAVQNFATQEVQNLIYQPSPGVNDNMIAKKKFYQHLKT